MSIYENNCDIARMMRSAVMPDKMRLTFLRYLFMPPSFGGLLIFTAGGYRHISK